MDSPAAPQRRGLRVFGHPAHAALSAFPLGILPLSVVADAVALLAHRPLWWAASFWLVVGGLLLAVPTVGAGLFDFLTIVRTEAAQRTGTTHMLFMLSGLSCFGIDLLVRLGTAPPSGAVLIATVALDVAGAALLSVGGWYGGDLVFGHGIGVEQKPPA